MVLQHQRKHHQHQPLAEQCILHVFTYLDAIALGNLKLIIREKDLDGAFFLQCTREDLQATGIGRLKWKKIKMYMPQ